MARRTGTVYDPRMIGRRGFLALLPALVAAPVLARALPDVPLRFRPDALKIATAGFDAAPDFHLNGVPAYENDGTSVDTYAGIDRDAYTAYYRFNVAYVLADGTERTVGRIDHLLL